MSAALRAEWLRLRYTRSLLAVPAAGLVVAVAGTVLLLTVGEPEEIGSALSRFGPLRFGPTSAGLLLMVLGVRVFTDETHHRTLPGTLLREPRRHRVVAAKLVVATATAAAFCLLTYALVVPVTAAGVALLDVDLALDAGPTARLLGRVVAAMVLLTALGVAVGVLLRSRTVALLAVALWSTLGEDLVGALFKGDRYLPGAAAQRLVSAPADGTSSALGAALVLALLVAAAFAAAAVSLRRDVP